MEQSLSISEVALEVGLSSKTIRFYEESGVIKPLARADNSYRRFSERDVQRLQLIKRARDIGLPLSEIKNIVSECIDKGCLEARNYVAENVPSYLHTINRRLAELQTLKQDLLALQAHYQADGKEWAHSTDTCCEIIPTTVKG
jgi:MerR family transcriptional regulator, copper efflux regulator